MIHRGNRARLDGGGDDGAAFRRGRDVEVQGRVDGYLRRSAAGGTRLGRDRGDDAVVVDVPLGDDTLLTNRRELWSRGRQLGEGLPGHALATLGRRRPSAGAGRGGLALVAFRPGGRGAGGRSGGNGRNCRRRRLGQEKAGQLVGRAVARRACRGKGVARADRPLRGGASFKGLRLRRRGEDLIDDGLAKIHRMATWRNAEAVGLVHGRKVTTSEHALAVVAVDGDALRSRRGDEGIGGGALGKTTLERNCNRRLLRRRRLRDRARSRRGAGRVGVLAGPLLLAAPRLLDGPGLLGRGSGLLGLVRRSVIRRTGLGGNDAREGGELGSRVVDLRKRHHGEAEPIDSLFRKGRALRHHDRLRVLLARVLGDLFHGLGGEPSEHQGGFGRALGMLLGLGEVGFFAELALVRRVLLREADARAGGTVDDIEIGIVLGGDEVLLLKLIETVLQGVQELLLELANILPVVLGLERLGEVGAAEQVVLVDVEAKGLLVLLGRVDEMARVGHLMVRFGELLLESLRDLPGFFGLFALFLSLGLGLGLGLLARLGFELATSMFLDLPALLFLGLASRLPLGLLAGLVQGPSARFFLSSDGRETVLLLDLGLATRFLDQAPLARDQRLDLGERLDALAPHLPDARLGGEPQHLVMRTQLRVAVALGVAAELLDQVGTFLLLALGHLDAARVRDRVGLDQVRPRVGRLPLRKDLVLLGPGGLGGDGGGTLLLESLHDALGDGIRPLPLLLLLLLDGRLGLVPGVIRRLVLGQSTVLLLLPLPERGAEGIGERRGRLGGDRVGPSTALAVGAGRPGERDVDEDEGGGRRNRGGRGDRSSRRGSLGRRGGERRQGKDDSVVGLPRGGGGGGGGGAGRRGTSGDARRRGGGDDDGGPALLDGVISDQVTDVAEERIDVVVGGSGVVGNLGKGLN
ncbi:hypothetical protein VTJ83DRAFT_6462 [Remersonia thermophila]|uniref:Uncharacterized protein n=1 Tax=Remersonia thermophila TaxID=72144 RepID=A0ABR4D4W6_9PEZI